MNPNMAQVSWEELYSIRKQAGDLLWVEEHSRVAMFALAAIRDEQIRRHNVDKVKRAEKEATMEEYTGTVIEGTLRPEDLVPAFFAELDRRDSETATEIESSFEQELYWLSRPATFRQELDNNTDSIAELLNELDLSLNDVAPEGYYFGAHPDDGADFGFWSIED